MTDKVPQWLCQTQQYTPPKDNAKYLSGSYRAVANILSQFKRNANHNNAYLANTTLRLFGMLLSVVLVAVAKNYSFVIFMFAVTCARVALLSSSNIKNLIKVVMPAFLISFIILLPSVFMGSPSTMLFVCSKVVICSSLVMAFNLTSQFNEITRALRLVKVPNIVIFTFDLTVKYIMQLGEICANMLTALKTRTIGKNKNKKSATSGIMGTLFIKAKLSADSTAQAMECRGFSGNYVVTKRKTKIKIVDILYILAYVAITAVFVYFEFLIR